MTTPNAAQRAEGPFLDRMFSFRLPDGRRVAVVSFAAVPSYHNVLEGGLRPAHNAAQREGFRRLAAARTFAPVLEIEPAITAMPEYSRPEDPRERLPWIACIAHLVSEPLGDLVGSHLTLLWWVDALPRPLPEEIERAARGIVWERSARDYDMP
jgi:hypothetical protein